MPVMGRPRGTILPCGKKWCWEKHLQLGLGKSSLLKSLIAGLSRIQEVCVAQVLCEHSLRSAGLSCWEDFSTGEGAGTVSLGTGDLHGYCLQTPRANSSSWAGDISVTKGLIPSALEEHFIPVFHQDFMGKTSILFWNLSNCKHILIK